MSAVGTQKKPLIDFETTMNTSSNKAAPEMTPITVESVPGNISECQRQTVKVHEPTRYAFPIGGDSRWRG